MRSRCALSAASSIHIAMTAAPAMGAPLSASRTNPSMTPVESASGRDGQSRARMLDAAGTASTMNCSESLATVTARAGSAKPSESSSGCMKPSEYCPCGTSGMRNAPSLSLIALRTIPSPPSLTSCTSACASGFLPRLSKVRPLIVARELSPAALCAASDPPASQSDRAVTPMDNRVSECADRNTGTSWGRRAIRTGEPWSSKPSMRPSPVIGNGAGQDGPALLVVLRLLRARQRLFRPDHDAAARTRRAAEFRRRLQRAGIYLHAGDLAGRHEVVDDRGRVGFADEHAVNEDLRRAALVAVRDDLVAEPAGRR